MSIVHFFARYLIFSALIFSACKENRGRNTPEYLRWVGDIKTNTVLDQASFHTCREEKEVLQYFHLQNGPTYYNEKSTLLSVFKSDYKPFEDEDKSGLIRIRFIVNCEGKAGRFRILQADENYTETKFHNRTIDQLLNITKSIKKWPALSQNEKPIDYYFYLIFRIKNGKITEILP